MDILIWKDNQKHGPYSEDEVQQHLKTGRFSEHDLGWTDGQSDWAPLSTIVPVSTIHSPLQNEKISSSEPPAARRTEIPAKTISGTILEKATATARLTQKQAHKKKLEMVDLKQADYQIGKKAYEGNITSEKYPEIRSQITELRKQIEVLRTTTEPPADTLTDKAKAAVGAAAKTAKIEALSLKQKAHLTDLGTKLRLDTVTDPALAPEVAAGRKTAEIIHALNAEIQSLSSQTFTWARRPLLLIAVVIALFMVSIGYGWFKGVYQRWSVERETHHIQQQAETQTARIALEIAELKRKDVENRRKEQQEREVQRAQEQLDQQKREIERQSAERTRLAKMETEQQKRSAEREESQRRKTQLDAERTQKDELAKKQEQEQRAEFAANRFSRISLLPRAALSPMLKRLNSTVELRGKDIDTLQSFLNQRDYLKLICFLRERQYAEYPAVGEIESALSKLTRGNFSILLRSTINETRDSQLYLISFPESNYKMVDLSSSWERHPDGIGYVHKWSLSDGQVIVVVGNYETVQKPIYAFNDSARHQSEALKQKRQLGEIDEATYQARLEELRRTTYDNILQWALNR